ncbi:hypothetical protein AMTRI_Chr09g41510 [Amborella trichopoda]|uniref:Dirigent protein n=1 Tax=Amborella trichopoda TaxID=13333 RepID=W1PZ44_AMBTC|nr:dirigent protein 21 [Amborella trichopoda]ERN13404.1 hypothetical protein AMTR_s00041p00178500 [Amborella trichopoda]|eukprot:XP_006851937.1 dirigent protein 21 [Amborella trichopoda]
MRGNAALATGIASLLLVFSSMPICQAQLGLGEAKVSYIDFYLHDLLVADKPTAVTVAKANTTSASPTVFGEVVIADDPLTEGPELTSKWIGKAQGLYAFSSQSEFSLFMALNLAFTDGEFNGSTLTVIGRNPVQEKVRELSIVGGTGAFRLASGYVLIQTFFLDTTTLNAVVHYNVTVIHY